MRLLLLVAALVFVTLAAFPASEAYVFGGSTPYSTYLEGIRIQDATNTEFIIAPQRGQASYGATYNDYPPGYCSDFPLSLNTFNDNGDLVLVWCDIYGVATLVEASQSPDMYALPTSPHCNVSYCIPTADVTQEARDDQLGSCEQILGSSAYSSASAFEVLLSFPTSRPYAPIGQKSWFVVNDLSGAMSRFVGVFLDQSDYSPQFQMPDTSVYPAAASTYQNEDIVHIACVHELAPIRFLTTPLELPEVDGSTPAVTVGPDVYSDFSGIFRTLFAPTDQQVGRAASPINDVLFPASMTYQEKDLFCDSAFPGTHAATARQVESFLQNHVSPVSSFFTFANSPSACADATTLARFQHPFFTDLFGSGFSASDFDNLFAPLEHILRCLPMAFVVADYCNPLIPQSFFPVSALNDFVTGTNNFASYDLSNPTQLPLLTEAQHALDWCMNGDQCVADNCEAPVSSSNCDANVAKSLLTGLGAKYTQKYATHGALACTYLPRTVVPIELCTNQSNFQRGRVCARNGDSGFHAPTIITPELTFGSNSWDGASDPASITLSYFSESSPSSATLSNAVFFRVLPMRNGLINNPYTMVLTFSSNGPIGNIWVTGCGYSDDCDAWTTLPQVEDFQFPSLSTSSQFSITINSGSDCGLFIAVGSSSGDSVNLSVDYNFPV